MLVSVIVPVYKVEDKIKRCVDSILSQTYNDFELILIDDGSPDNSGKICDEYAKKDNRIRVIHNKNQGVSATRNRGIQEARGEYVAFVDSDDYVHPDFLKCLSERAIGSDIAVCSYYIVGENKTDFLSHGFGEKTLTNQEIRKILFKNVILNKTDGYYSIWNKLFKREFLIQNNILINQKMTFGEDLCFVLDCLSKCSKISFTDKPLYYYEQLSTGLFSRYRSSVLDDALLCFEKVKQITKPYNNCDPDYKYMKMKYLHYINRQIEGACINERNKRKELKRIFSNPIVNEIFESIICWTKEEREKLNFFIEEADLRIPNWVTSGKKAMAIEYALYLYNPKSLLKRLRGRG